VRVAKQRDLDRHGVPAGSAHQDSPPRWCAAAGPAVTNPHRALPVRADASVDQQAVLPNPKRAKGQSDGNLDQLLNAAFLASVVIEWA